MPLRNEQHAREMAQTCMDGRDFACLDAVIETALDHGWLRIVNQIFRRMPIE